MTAPYANPRKTQTIRRLGSVDISRLKEEILAIPESLWESEDSTKPNNFEALGRTRHIVFRFIDSLSDWRASHDLPLWQEWRDRLMPTLEQAVGDYGYARGAFPRVMLARMAPDGVIKPHQDANLAAKWPHKIHVPIQTNDGVTFYIDGVGHILPAGEAVEVNNMAMHAVTNAGDTDRIHLIFEYYDLDQPDPDWIQKA